MSNTMAVRELLQRTVERQDWCRNGRWSLAQAAFDRLTGLSQVGSGRKDKFCILCTGTDHQIMGMGQWELAEQQRKSMQKQNAAKKREKSEVDFFGIFDASTGTGTGTGREVKVEKWNKFFLRDI